MVPFLLHGRRQLQRISKTVQALSHELGTIKMNYALVRRTVTDIANWRAAYSEYAPKRAEAGLSDTMVLYSVDKPNEVWTLHGAQDLAALHKFTATIRPVMQQTGLQDEPDFYYLTDYRDATDRDSFTVSNGRVI
jgi:hypothetical protein